MRKLNMTKLENLQTANSLLNDKYGKEGSASRCVFDQESKTWYEEQTMEEEYLVTMPLNLHSRICEMASKQGLSFSAFITKHFASEFAFTD